MYIADFDAFYQQAEELFRARPLDTRYCIKYRNCDGKLVLKVTDNRTCLQYKTDQQADLKKLERLNNLFLALTSKGDATAGQPLVPTKV
ncbi:signal recognition particle, SRP9/SRP14 subunit [Haematococcus lacustris]